MILGVPFNIYSREYIFFNISNRHNTTIKNSRFVSSKQTDFPVAYSTQHVTMNGLSIILDSDVNIEDNLVKLENDIIEEFLTIGQISYPTIVPLWKKHMVESKYTDMVLFSCKGVKLYNDQYIPIYTITPIPNV